MKKCCLTEINLNTFLMQRSCLTEMNGSLHFWPLALHQRFRESAEIKCVSFLHDLAAAVLKALRFFGFCANSIITVIPDCKRDALYALYGIHVPYNTCLHITCTWVTTRRQCAPCAPSKEWHNYILYCTQKFYSWSYLCEQLNLHVAMNNPDTKYSPFLFDWVIAGFF